jgi:hypothetical protein
MATEAWQMNNPHRVHPDHVILDDDSTQIIETAIYQLGVCRSPMGHDDPMLRVHTLATLIAGADALLADAVADARDQDYPWADIAQQLGVTADTARRRYSQHHRTRRLPIDVD